MKNTGIKGIRKLTKALHEAGYDVSSPLQSPLVEGVLPEFMKHLSPAAKALIDAPVKAIEPGFVSFQVGSLWPMKDWYQHKFAEAFNRIVEGSDVKNVLCHGSSRLAVGGEICVDSPDPLNGGPDEYGVGYVFFHSDLTVDQLERKYGYRGHFGREGEITIAFPSWFMISKAERDQKNVTV